jgi:hypothetical protein
MSNSAGDRHLNLTAPHLESITMAVVIRSNISPTANLQDRIMWVINSDEHDLSGVGMGDV